MPPDPSEPTPEPRPGVDPVVPALEKLLGCPLPDAALALAALTHKSYVNEHRAQGLCDNERLEFLGDAVIDLAVAHRLMERFPDAREGDLSRLRAAVVDEAGLAKMARDIGIGPLLRLGRGEELTGGREKASLLADAMEAVIAAVYLSGGLEPVLKLIDRFLGEAFASAAAGTLDRDFKTQLQELAQSRLRATPRYRVVAEHGPDHSKTFEVELELRGEVIGRGAGRSKKDAEQAAAKDALASMNGRFGFEPRPLQFAPAPADTPLPESIPPAEIVEAAEAVEAVETESVETVESAPTAQAGTGPLGSTAEEPRPESAPPADSSAAPPEPPEPPPDPAPLPEPAPAVVRRRRVTTVRARAAAGGAKAKKGASAPKRRAQPKRKSRARR